MPDKIAKSYQDATGGWRYRFHCPGCGYAHFFTIGGTAGWEWNGSTESPTVKPSILVNGFSNKPDDMKRCHSFITDGKIQFLGDCEHSLAGKTVELPSADTEVLFHPENT